MPNDYRTIASGDFHNPIIWETYVSGSWVAATFKPDRNNNIFINQDHEIRLIQNEEANHVYLFSAASPGRKLNLQNFELHVYGALRGFQVEFGDFYLNTVTNATLDWIYPESGRIVFKGSSRIVVDRSSWSATNNNSRYTVVFNPDNGQNLIVNSAFKSNSFIIQTGTVTQTINTDGLAACSTFSFNIQAAFGLGAYGDLIIEPGATLISNCSGITINPSIQRTGTIPGALLHLKQGGNLILTGIDPRIDVANFQLYGNVYFRSNSGNQRMIRTTMAASGNPKTYHNLFFENGSTKILNDSIFLTGDFSFVGGGPIQESPTFLCFQGNADQQVVNWEMNLNQIEVDKPGGTLFTNADLRVKSNFLMKSGQINFGGNRLFLNTSGTGSYFKTGGSWLNLSQLNYNQIPPILTAENAGFPFEDVFQGGVREVQLLGNSLSGNLIMDYMEIPGANWDPMFDDTDGTNIMYQLNSYFRFSGLTFSTNSIELRISADNLIVDNVDDLRIVSNGQAAPGTHLIGLDPAKLWARRDLVFGELSDKNFTVGSYRVLSILPVAWLELKAEIIAKEIIITWSTTKEFQNEKFILYRSLSNANNFKPIGEVKSKGDSDTIQSYDFKYRKTLDKQPVYFQLEQVDKNKSNSYSKVFRLERYFGEPPIEMVRIWPNPYKSGDFNIDLPEFYNPNTTRVSIVDTQGILLRNEDYQIFQYKNTVSKLNPGLYFISFCDQKNQQTFRLIKR